jgi:Na+-driven multidrug efflux pump
MLHKIFFIVLIMFSGSCGSAALLSARHLFHDPGHVNAIAGAAVLVFVIFGALSIVIWFHKEQPNRE